MILPDGADKLLSANVGMGSEATVLVVLDLDCQPCLESMPFYKKLLALPRMDGFKRRVVVLSKRGVVPIARMLDQQGFKPHKLTSGPAAVREVETAPTVVVIGPNGKRRGAWTGRLTAAQEAEVFAAIGS